MIENSVASSRKAAVQLGEALRSAGEIKHVSKEHKFKDAYMFYEFSKGESVSSSSSDSESEIENGIALVAHNNKKNELVEWSKKNKKCLEKYSLVGTGTTGGLIEEATGLSVERVRSGPLGGDQQIGAYIASNQIKVLIFFWDPLTAQPHDADVKALLRLAVLYNVSVAMNVASADNLLKSL